MDTGKKQRKGKKRKMNEKGHLKKCIVGTAVVLGMLTILTAVFIRRSLTADASDSVIFVSMEGDSFDQKFFRGTTDMVVTIRERLFDSSTLSILIQDETGREARITYDEERKAWEGLDGLEGAAIEAAAYETETGSRFLFDSEEGKETYTEKRTIEMKFRFSGEGTYIIREIACDDLAGNHSALEKPVSFTIDKTAPLMEILLPPEEEKGRAGYYSTPVTVWLYLKEHNFSTEERAEKPEIFLMNGEKEEMVSAKDITWKAAPEKGEDWYKASVMCTGDASYGLRVSYKDPAGWEPAGESKTECGFTVDTTPPDYGTVTAMGQSWDSFLDHVTFGLFSMKEEVVFLEGGDSVTPVEPLQYYIAAKALSRKELEGLAEEEWKTGNSLLLEPDSMSVVYLRITNYAGLSEYFNSDGILLENKGPVIELEAYGDKAPGSSIYRSDVKVEISLHEQGESGIDSGIKKAGYSIGVKAEDGSADTEVIEEAVLMDASGGTEIKTEWKGSLTVPAEKYNERLALVAVWAEDFAGNRSEKLMECAVDKSAPDILIEFDRTDPSGGKYYDQIRTATVKIREVNFSEEDVQFEITNTDGRMPKISDWNFAEGCHQCKVAFEADGDYSFSVICQDMAGNVSEKKEDEFTIDRTPPQVTVTFKEPESGKGIFYRTGRRAEITVKEHNFHESGIEGRIISTLQSKGNVRQSNGTQSAEGEEIVKKMKESDFSHSGDIHRAEFDFELDGIYAIKMGFVDLAGNKQEGEAFETEFIIDQTAPEIKIDGIRDRSANRGSVLSAVTCQDTYLDHESCMAEILRLGRKSETGTITKNSLGGIMQFLMEDFSYEPDSDGVYLLTALAQDKAGNKTEKQIRFSVNRYGSVYAVDEETKSWLYPENGSHPYLKEEKDVVIREYNVDKIDQYQVTVCHDGAVRILTENEDYTRTELEKSEQSVWQVYEYRIPKSNFKEEGAYEIVLHTEDAAGNRMGNIASKTEGREALCEFSIDKTCPSVILFGAKNGGNYKTDMLLLNLKLQDNMALKRAEVCLGDERKIYEGNDLIKGLEEKDGNIELVMKEKEDWQQLKVNTEDAAGNQSREEWRLFVNSKGMVHLYRKPVYLFLTVAAAAGFGGSAAGIILVIRKRKKRQEKQDGQRGRI